MQVDARNDNTVELCSLKSGDCFSYANNPVQMVVDLENEVYPNPDFPICAISLVSGALDRLKSNTRVTKLNLKVVNADDRT